MPGAGWTTPGDWIGSGPTWTAPSPASTAPGARLDGSRCPGLPRGAGRLPLPGPDAPGAPQRCSPLPGLSAPGAPAAPTRCPEPLAGGGAGGVLGVGRGMPGGGGTGGGGYRGVPGERSGRTGRSRRLCAGQRRVPAGRSGRPPAPRPRRATPLPPRQSHSNGAAAPPPAAPGPAPPPPPRPPPRPRGSPGRGPEGARASPPPVANFFRAVKSPPAAWGRDGATVKSPSPCPRHPPCVPCLPLPRVLCTPWFPPHPPGVPCAPPRVPPPAGLLPPHPPPAWDPHFPPPTRCSGSPAVPRSHLRVHQGRISPRSPLAPTRVPPDPPAAGMPWPQHPWVSPRRCHCPVGCPRPSWGAARAPQGHHTARGVPNVPKSAGGGGEHPASCPPPVAPHLPPQPWPWQRTLLSPKPGQREGTGGLGHSPGGGLGHTGGIWDSAGRTRIHRGGGTRTHWGDPEHARGVWDTVGGGLGHIGGTGTHRGGGGGTGTHQKPSWGKETAGNHPEFWQ